MTTAREWHEAWVPQTLDDFPRGFIWRCESPNGACEKSVALSLKHDQQPIRVLGLNNVHHLHFSIWFADCEFPERVVDALPKPTQADVQHALRWMVGLEGSPVREEATP